VSVRLSPSSIQTYRRCSLQWWFAYVARVRLKPAGKVTQGRAVHRGIEVALKEKQRSGALPPRSVVQDAAVEEFDRLAELTWWEQPGEARAMREETPRLVGLHHERVAPEIQPLLVEHYLCAPAGEAELEMVVDCVDATPNGGVRVRDHKVRRQRTSPDQLRTDLQLAAYTVGLEQAGHTVEEVRLDQLLALRRPEVDSHTLPRAEVDTQRVERVASRVARAIRYGVFHPVDDVRVCGWCGYRSICWGRAWWKYLEDPELARRAAREHLAGRVLEGTISGQDNDMPDW
jgi:CRISPR/Cas system-associated exonuclease Cas4 (RecB family)